MLKTVKGRLLALQGGLLLILGLGVWLVHLTETSPATLLVQDGVDRSSNTLKQVKAQLSRSQDAFAFDYSYWDEMVVAIQKSDTAWFDSYLPQAMRTFEVDLVWVCDSTWNAVYGYNRLQQRRQNLSIPVPQQEATALVSNKRFPHYFWLLDGTLCEVSVAPVQPIADSLRISRARGYFVTGHLWDETHLSELSHKADASLSLVAPSVDEELWVSKQDAGVLRFSDTLCDWSGRPIRVLQAESYSRPLFQMVESAKTREYVLAGLIVVVLAFWWVSVRRFILGPLGRVSEALQQESTTPIADLRNEESEFGVVARLVKWYFDQRAELQNEIRDHLIAEGTLQASLEHLESVTDELNLVLANATDFIYRQDTFGNFTYLSPSVTEITGYAIEEFKTHYTLLLTDHPMNQEVIKNTEYALMTGTAVPPYRAEIFHKDRRRIVIEVSERPHLENGKVVGLIGVARDITQLVEQERQQEQLTEQLRRSERMETLAMMAGGVAHDLNNTLGPLVAYPELILSGMDHASEYRQELEQIQHSALQAASIVQDLLTTARRGRFQMAPIDLNKVISGYFASASFKELRQRHPNIRLETKLCDDVMTVIGSEHHLQSALMNLVTNAFEAMGDQGTLTIQSELADAITCQRQSRIDAEAVVIRVSDTGPGIPEELQARILEPYFSTKQMGRSGSGLGLSVVNGIVGDHSGCLKVHSQPGEGTTFEIRLPRTSEKPRAIAVLPDSVTGSETILVLDDLPSQGTVASRILQGFGYQVFSATNLEDAVQIVRDEQIDLLVLDMLLCDEYDGLDALRTIHAVDPTIRVLVISGYAFTQRIQEILNSCPSQFLAKPYSSKGLGGMVRSVLDQACQEAAPASTR